MPETPKKNIGKKKGKGVGGNGNLIPAKKGEVRNPKGRPKKGSAIADILNDMGDELIEVNGVKITKRKAVMMKVYQLAVKGESWAVHFIADRTEGKAIDRIVTQSTDELVIE
jgi:hypothetical protein